MEYDIRIDIEAVESNDDCSRPVNDVILCESDDENVVEEFWSKLQSLFPNTDVEGIKNERKNRTVYTLFVHKIDERESTEYYEELDLARFTELKKAKQLMKEIIKSLTLKSGLIRKL